MLAAEQQLHFAPKQIQCLAQSSSDLQMESHPYNMGGATTQLTTQ
jgi:hypothetical protein